MSICYSPSVRSVFWHFLPKYSCSQPVQNSKKLILATGSFVTSIFSWTKPVVNHFGRVASSYFMYTPVSHSVYSRFRWGSMGYSGSLWCFAAQKRLKTTELSDILIWSVLRRKTSLPVLRPPGSASSHLTILRLCGRIRSAATPSATSWTNEKRRKMETTRSCLSTRRRWGCWREKHCCRTRWLRASQGSCCTPQYRFMGFRNAVYSVCAKPI